MKSKWVFAIVTMPICMLFGYFMLKATSTVPTEFDSITYHIPLAKSILSGQILRPDLLTFPNKTFPAASELILAVMIAFHVPLNMFNILAWMILAYLLHRLGCRYRLKQNTFIFMLSVITLPTVIRLLLSQTVDIWLAVFFVWTLFLLQKPEKKIGYFFQLGLSMGLFIGTKYSGPLFLLALLLAYGKKVISHLSFWRFFMFFLPFSLFGTSWYIRNMFVFSNPFYPSPFLWMKGISAFSPEVFLTHLNMIITTKNGLLYTVNAILSEYLFWPIICIFTIYFAYKSHKSQSVSDEERRLLVLGSMGIIVYLIIPGYAYNYNNYVSEIRYSIPVIISFILLFFYHVQKMMLSSHVYIFVLLNGVAIITLLFQGRYHPKIIVAIGAVFFFLMTIYLPTKRKHKFDKIDKYNK